MSFQTSQACSVNSDPFTVRELLNRLILCEMKLLFQYDLVCGYTRVFDMLT